MKTVILITLLLVVLVCGTIGITYKTNENQTMNTSLNTVGLPKYGLIFIEPTDVYYNQIIDATFQSQTVSNFEELKPFSVLLRNNSNKILISFKLKWEIEDASGQVTIITRGYTNTRRIFDVEDKSKTKSVLEPNEMSLCSVVDVLPVNQYSDSRSHRIDATAVLRKDNEDLQQVLPAVKSDEGITDLVERLPKSRRITVSIDGALFEDGIFVGPDSSNFYGWLTSLIDSKKDLIESLRNIQQNGNSSRMKEFLENESKVPQVTLNQQSTLDDLYKFNKRRFARNLLRLRNAIGDDAIRPQLKILSQRQIKLQRIN